MGREPGNLPDHPGERRGERRAAECGGDDADEGDADLHGREKGVGRLGELEGETGARVAGIGELAEFGFAGGDDGDLRHGKNTVGDKQGEDDGDLEEDGRHGWRANATGGRIA